MEMVSGCTPGLLATLAFQAVLCGGVNGEVSSKRVNDMWDYKPSHGCNGGRAGACGPDEWSTIPGFESCAQQGTQSPIDMPVAEAAILKDQGFALEGLNHACGAAAHFELNEHTVEVDYSGTDCMGKYHATWKGHRYVLLQFHYHSPSENLWDGGQFPMEVHYVHKCLDCGGPEFMVVASMIGVGDSPSNSFLRQVLRDAPNVSAKGGDNFYESPTFALPPYSFLPQSIGVRQLYFEGSMTTPPCNPGPTHWVMASDVAYVEQSTVDMYRDIINSVPNNQLATFGAIEGKDAAAIPVFAAKANESESMWNGSLGSNNRPIQPLRGHDNPSRKVYLVADAAGGARKVGILNLVAGFVFIVAAVAVFGYVARGKPLPRANGPIIAKNSPHREPLLASAEPLLESPPPVPHYSRTSFSEKL